MTPTTPVEHARRRTAPRLHGSRGAALAAVVLGLLFAGCTRDRAASAPSRGPLGTPRFDHIVVVIEENHAGSQILGPDSPAAYMKELARGGASFSESFGVTHPSQPNYLALFCGSTMGVVDDSLPEGIPYSVPNLAAALAARGLSFAGYSQSLPFAGYNGEEFTREPGLNQYMRKHAPWANWQSEQPGPNRLPPSVNQPFEHTFPVKPDGRFEALPTVSFVVPDEQCDMHDGSIEKADAWLRDNLAAYAEWAKTHNSLLIVTWDEDNATPVNRIPTFFYGAHVKPGVYSGRIDHYSILRTIVDAYGLEPIGASAKAKPVREAFD